MSNSKEFSRLHLTNVIFLLAWIVTYCYHCNITALQFNRVVAVQNPLERQPVNTLNQQCKHLRRHATTCQRISKYSIQRLTLLHVRGSDIVTSLWCAIAFFAFYRLGIILSTISKKQKIRLDWSSVADYQSHNISSPLRGDIMQSVYRILWIRSTDGKRF